MTEQLIGQTLAGKYRLEQILREDGFGKTFRATHVLMEKSVAVKILNPELATNTPVVEDFQQEAKLLSRLAHPHILSVNDFGVDERIGIPFVVMENFDGRTLKDLIQIEGALQLSRAVLILTQVAEALAAAHEHGLVHGALRSDSILLIGSGSRDFIKVVDFDAANKTSNIDFYNRETAHNLIEPVAYLSPEQCSDASLTDARTDIYSLGIILYETLTGRLPFTGASTTEVMMKHVQEIPPSLLALRHDLQPTFEQIVQRSLAKNPAQRFQTAEEFAAALESASEGSPLPVYQREADTIVRPRSDAAAVATAADARWKTAFIVLAGISLLSVALFWFTQNRRTTPATDPNASPVFPINPATGQPEQNLSTDLTNLGFNANFDANLSAVPPGGGGGGTGITGVPDRIPPGLYQNYPPGYVDPNSNSLFMQDLNAIPSPVPSPKISPKPSASPSPTGSPAAAATSPTPQVSPRATGQPTPAAPTPNQPTSPKPTQPPARSTPIPKPTTPPTEKSSQSLSDRISDR